MKETAFISEILMQPSALHDVVDFYESDEGAALLMKAADVIVNARKVVFTGMGTSLYAPYVLLKELSEVCSSIGIRDAGELYHFESGGIQPGDVLIARLLPV